IVETRPRAQIVRPAFATRDYGRGPGGGGYGEAGERRGSYGARYDAPLLRTQVSARAAGNSEGPRSEEHTSELQSLMRISYAVFCLKKKNITPTCAKT